MKNVMRSVAGETFASAVTLEDQRLLGDAEAPQRVRLLCY